MENLFSVGSIGYYIAAIAGGYILTLIGERREDRRRGVSEIATGMTEKNYPAPLVKILSEYAIGDLSGAAKALWDFVKLMKDPVQRKAMHKDFLSNSLNAALIDPETFATIKKAVEGKAAEIARGEQEIHDRVAASQKE